MKGFPNQLANITKIRDALDVLARAIGRGVDVADDDTLGEALLDAGVLGAGHGGHQSVAAYLRDQRSKPRSRRSHETSARGFREFLTKLGAIHHTATGLALRPLAQQLIAADPNIAAGALVWHRALMALEHTDPQGTSHPYAVLIRLVTKLGALPKHLTPLALEARNDSAAELNRVAGYAKASSEAAARRAVGVSPATWANARKVIPPLALSVHALVDSGGVLTLGPNALPAGAAPPRPALPAPVVPRTLGRAVRVDTIGRQPTPGAGGEFGNVADPAVTQALREARTTEHQQVVQALAGFIEQRHTLSMLREDPMDLLATVRGVTLLAEVKTLDGTFNDEVAQVRASLAQLYYYRCFNVPDPVGGAVALLAVFSRRLSAVDHERFLAAVNVAVVWRTDATFLTTAASDALLPAPLRGLFGIA